MTIESQAKNMWKDHQQLKKKCWTEPSSRGYINISPGCIIGPAASSAFPKNNLRLSSFTLGVGRWLEDIDKKYSIFISWKEALNSNVQKTFSSYVHLEMYIMCTRMPVLSSKSNFSINGALCVETVLLEGLWRPLCTCWCWCCASAFYKECSQLSSALCGKGGYGGTLTLSSVLVY